MKTQNRHYCCLLFFLIQASLFAQQNKPLTPSELRTDFDQLISLVEAHPNPFGQISEKEFYTLVDSVGKQLDRPLDRLHFFKLVCPVIGTLQDGHSGVSPPWDELKNRLKKNGVFPHQIHLNEAGRMFVVGNFGKSADLPLGAEILALNGVTVADFLHRSRRYISFARPSMQYTAVESLLDLYLWLEFGDITSLQVRFKTYQEHTSTIHFTKFSRKKRKANLLVGTLAQPYSFEVIGKEVGCLKIQSFQIPNRATYELFLEKTFRSLRRKKTKNLIVDLRGNPGGLSEAAADLMHFISGMEYPLFVRTEMKASEASRRFNQSRFWLKQPAWAELLGQTENGETVVLESPPTREGQAKKNTFRGNLFLLVDGSSFSSSAAFAAAFKCHQLGLVVGTETGGSQVFPADPIHEKLAHSGLHCRMSTTLFYTPCFLNGHNGISPHATVKPTVAHLILGWDFMLNYTLKIIENGNTAGE